jgi:coenzyme PQQ synthesis protein D (PqqD)
VEASTLSVRVAETQLSCNLAGEVVILNLADGIYYGLNAVGSRIWELLKESRALDDIEMVLVEEYEVDQDECRRAIGELVGRLLEKGLLQVSEAGH